MNPAANDKEKQNPNPAPHDPYENTDRDEGTLGTHHDREAGRDGMADEDQPKWSPPESQPEPRPVDPILDPSNSAPITNSPA